MKRKILLIYFIFLLFHLYPKEYRAKLVEGSNVYVRIFLFYFPLAEQMSSSVTGGESYFHAGIHMNRDEILREPIHESEKKQLFDTDLMVHIRNIPIKKTGYYNLEVTFRGNKKIIKRNVEFKVISKQNIMVLRGQTDLLLGEINDSDDFKNRENWKYPIYFDLRFQLTERK